MNTDKDRDEAREAFRKMNRRQKLGYIWSYYKVWFFVALLAVILIAAAAGWHAAHPRVYTMVQATLMNADSLQVDKSSFFDDFAAAQGYADDETVTVEDGYVVDFDQMDERSTSSLQVLAAEFASGGIDLFISEEDLFSREAAIGAFQNLADILPADVLEKYEDRLYFRQEEGDAATDAEPVGIRLGNNQLVRDGVYSKDQTLIAGIGSQSENTEEAVALLTTLLETETES